MVTDTNSQPVFAPRWSGSDHPYAGRMAVLATKHGKLPLIAPPLEQAVGLRVEAVAVDTDILGTFTGDIPRQGPPLDTAIAKARLGIDAAGCPLGLASEGSISPDSAMPFIHSDKEIVVLVDDENGIVVWESHSSWDIVAATVTANSIEGLESFLVHADFPNHKLIVRPNSGVVRPVYKGIATVDGLVAVLDECATASADGLAVVETDLRAHACPSRRAIIACTAKRLADRIAARCPVCGAPGWGRVDVLLGVPCSWCGTEVARSRAEIDGCASCEYRQTRPIASADLRADPGECPVCNP